MNLDPSVNPLLEYWAFGGFILLIVVWGIVSSWRQRSAWMRERGRVRGAVLNALALDGSLDEEDVDAQARARVLALVPCKGEDLKGNLGALGTGRIWLCLLTDRLLLVDGQDAHTVALDNSAMGKLYLVNSKEYGKLFVDLDVNGEKSRLEVERVSDLVRVVNILIGRNITLGFSQV